MKLVKIVIALLVIAGTAYWAYDSVRQRSYSGSGLEFVVGNGNRISIANEAPVALDMTASSSFAVTSSDTELGGSGTREGSGRSAIYRHAVELPEGDTEFRVTRGSNITVALAGSGSVEVTPMEGDAARSTIIVAIVIILGALFYLSRTLEHRWLKALMLKVSPGSQTAAQQSAS